MHVNIQKLKDSWKDIRSFMQHKVQTLSDVKERHNDEVNEYKQFCEFVEPATLKEKLEGAIEKIKRE
jgi:hypothetical protein